MVWTHTYNRPGCKPRLCFVSLDPGRGRRVWIVTSIKGKSRSVRREHVREVLEAALAANRQEGE